MKLSAPLEILLLIFSSLDMWDLYVSYNISITNQVMKVINLNVIFK